MVVYETLMNLLGGSTARLIIPFLLVFVIVYGVLRRIGIFDQGGGGGSGEGKKIDFAVALIGALVVVRYTPFVEGVFWAYLTNIFGAVAVLLMAILGFHLLEGMASGRNKDDGSLVNSAHAWVIGVVVLFLFIGYGGPRMLGGGRLDIGSWIPIFSTADFMLFLVLALVIGAMYWLYAGEDGQK